MAARPDPHLLGAGGLGGLLPLFEVGIPQRDRVLVEAVNEAAERHAELVLVARELDPVLNVWHALAEHADPGKATGSTFHVVMQVRAEQIKASIGETPCCLLRRTGR